MVEDPEALPDVPRTIPEILEVIERHLKRIADALENVHGKSPSQREQRKPSKSVTVQIVQGYFTKEQLKLVEVTNETKFIKVKFLKFEQPDIFAVIAKIIGRHGGEYISAGKLSHFRIPT